MMLHSARNCHSKSSVFLFTEMMTYCLPEHSQDEKIYSLVWPPWCRNWPVRLVGRKY